MMKPLLGQNLLDFLAESLPLQVSIEMWGEK